MSNLTIQIPDFMCKNGNMFTGWNAVTNILALFGIISIMFWIWDLFRTGSGK